MYRSISYIVVVDKIMEAKALLPEFSLRRMLKAVNPDVLVITLFLLLSLRVVTWFQYPNILISGDLRLPLSNEAFLKKALYTWSEIDFGIPSIYIPRLLDPLYFFTVLLRSLNIDLYIAETIAVFLIYFLTTTVTYLYVKYILKGDRVAAFIAATFLAANTYLICDREVTAIGFMDTALMIMPCLALFAKAMVKEDLKAVIISGVLFNLTYGAFPNPRLAILCIITLLLTQLYFFIDKGLFIRYQKTNRCKKIFVELNVGLFLKHLRLLFFFLMIAAVSSLWLISLTLASSEHLIRAYEEQGFPPFMYYLRIHDVVRLIAEWGFYTGYGDFPYVPYRDIYLTNIPFIILTYVPFAVAFATPLFLRCKLTIFFGFIALLSFYLITGLYPFTEVYIAATASIPFMKVFREPSSWAFIMIISYSILIGLFFSYIYNKFKKAWLQVTSLGLALTVFLLTSWPLITGDVGRNWLNPNVKGYYVPTYYYEINGFLPEDHWTILLPKRSDYVSYNFTNGTFTCGNPYPLIFSKPIVTGIGGEYIKSINKEIIEELYNVIDRGAREKNIALEAKAAASSIEKEGFEPEKAMDGDLQTRWSSQVGTPQFLELEWSTVQSISKVRILFESAYADDYIIETWNGTHWVTVVRVENNNRTDIEHIFPDAIDATKMRLLFTKASRFGSVSIWELEVYSIKYSDTISKLLGMLGIKYIVYEENIIIGADYTIDLTKLTNNVRVDLIKEWNGVKLLENPYGLQKLYIADNVIVAEDMSVKSMYNAVKGVEWSTLNHSVLIDA
ncbi:MAG: discoidin domain-containing protein, partial [Candidatus Methanomethylicia archaeon]